MIIALVNASTRVTDDQVEQIAAAIQVQMDVQVMPVWDRLPPRIIAVNGEGALPEGAAVLRLVDTISMDGALGYHTEGPDGSYWGDIAVSPVLDNSGGVLAPGHEAKDGDVGYSVSAVVSHEALELAMDETVNMYADGPAIHEGSSYALEVCDPVEATGYWIAMLDGSRVWVSNWVGPRWFDMMAPAGSFLDWGKTVSRPFELAPGGYCVVRKSPGTEIEVFAATMPPFWRLAQKSDNPSSRTSRRKRTRRIRSEAAPFGFDKSEQP